MRPRKYKRPPQGTVQVFSGDREARAERAVDRMMEDLAEGPKTYRALVRVVGFQPVDGSNPPELQILVVVPAWNPERAMPLINDCARCDAPPLDMVEKMCKHGVTYRFHAHVDLGAPRDTDHIHFQNFEDPPSQEFKR